MLGFRCLSILSPFALMTAGCAMPCTTTGWSFQVGRPATLSSPAAVAQGPASLAMYPVAAMPTASPRGATLAATGPDCVPCPPAGGHGGGMLAATGPACNLDEICSRLDRIERRLGNATGVLPPPRPMPPGPSTPQASLTPSDDVGRFLAAGDIPPTPIHAP